MALSSDLFKLYSDFRKTPEYQNDFDQVERDAIDAKVKDIHARLLEKETTAEDPSALVSLGRQTKFFKGLQAGTELPSPVELSSPSVASDIREREGTDLVSGPKAYTPAVAENFLKPPARPSMAPFSVPMGKAEAIRPPTPKEIIPPAPPMATAGEVERANRVVSPENFIPPVKERGYPYDPNASLPYKAATIAEENAPGIAGLAALVAPEALIPRAVSSVLPVLPRILPAGILAKDLVPGLTETGRSAMGVPTGKTTTDAAVETLTSNLGNAAFVLGGPLAKKSAYAVVRALPSLAGVIMEGKGGFESLKKTIAENPKITWGQAVEKAMSDSELLTRLVGFATFGKHAVNEMRAPAPAVAVPEQKPPTPEKPPLPPFPEGPEVKTIEIKVASEKKHKRLTDAMNSFGVPGELQPDVIRSITGRPDANLNNLTAPEIGAVSSAIEAEIRKGNGALKFSRGMFGTAAEGQSDSIPTTGTMADYQKAKADLKAEKEAAAKAEALPPEIQKLDQLESQPLANKPVVQEPLTFGERLQAARDRVAAQRKAYEEKQRIEAEGMLIPSPPPAVPESTLPPSETMLAGEKPRQAIPYEIEGETTNAKEQARVLPDVRPGDAGRNANVPEGKGADVSQKGQEAGSGNGRGSRVTVPPTKLEDGPVISAIKSGQQKIFLPEKGSRPGEYDDMPEKIGHKIFSPDGIPADVMAAKLAAAGLIPDSKPTTMWEAINGELRAKRNIRQAEAKQQGKERTLDDFHTDWERNKSEEIPASKLKPGDTFTVQGKGGAILEETDRGLVMLDGEHLPFDKSIRIDKGSLNQEAPSDNQNQAGLPGREPRGETPIEAKPINEGGNRPAEGDRILQEGEGGEVETGNKIIPALTEEEYLAQNGAGRGGFGDAGLHRSNSSVSDSSRASAIRIQAVKDRELTNKRNELRKEYQKKIASGEIRKPTRTDELIKTAQGHEDNQSVQAARRLLEKKGIAWKPEGAKTFLQDVAKIGKGKANSIENIVAEFASLGLKHALNFGHDLLRRGISEFIPWAKQMTAKFGSSVKGKLVQLWNGAKEMLKGLGRRGSAFGKNLEAKIPRDEKAMIGKAAEIGQDLAKQKEKTKGLEARARLEEEKATAIQAFREKIGSRDDIDKMKKELFDLAKKSIPAGSRYLVQALPAIRDAKTKDDIEAAALKVMGLGERGRKRQAIEQTEKIIKGMSKASPQFGYFRGLPNGKIPAKLRPEHQKQLNELMGQFSIAEPEGFAKMSDKERQFYVMGKMLKNFVRSGKIIRPDVQDTIEARVFKILEKKSFQDMSPSEIAFVGDRLKEIKKASDMDNIAYFGGEMKKTNEMVGRAIEHLDQRPDLESAGQEGESKRRGKLGYYFKDASRNGASAFSEFGPEGEKILKGLYDGENHTNSLRFEAEDLVNEAMRPFGMEIGSRQLKKWIEEKVMILSNGKEIKIPRGQALDIFAHSQAGYNHQNLLQNGYKPDYDISAKTLIFSEADLRDLAARVNGSPQEKALVESVYGVLNGNLKAKINEASTKLLGYEIATNQKYYPAAISQDVQQKGLNEAFRQFSQATLENSGFTKDRTGSNKPLAGLSILDRMQRHVNQAAAYAGSAVPLRQAKMFIGGVDVGGMADPRTGKTLRSVATDKLGEDFVNDVHDRLDAFEGMGTDKPGKFQEMVNKAYSTITRAYLGINPSPAIKQYAGLFTLAAELPADLVVKAFKTMATTREETKNILLKSPFFRERFGTVDRLSLPKLEMSDPNQVTGITLRMMNKADIDLSATAFLAAKAEIAAKEPGLSLEALEKKALDRAEEVFRKTQNPTSILDVSTIALQSRRNPALKPFTFLQAEGTARINYLRQSYNDFVSGKLPAGEMAKRAGMVLALSPLFAGAVGMGVNAGTNYVINKARAAMGKKEDKQVGVDPWFLAQKVLEENIGILPGGSSLVQIVKQTKEAAKNGMKNVSFEGPIGSTVTDGLKAIGAIYNSQYGKTRYQATRDKNLNKGIFDLVRTASTIMGVPQYPLKVVNETLIRK